jgi:diketogulonate reductase-like aldo/keto reductase
MVLSVLNYYDIKKIEYATDDNKYKDFILVSLTTNDPSYFMLDQKIGYYSDLKNDTTLSRDRLRSFNYTIHAFVQTQQNNMIYQPTLPNYRSSSDSQIPFGNFDLGGGHFFFSKKQKKTSKLLSAGSLSAGSLSAGSVSAGSRSASAGSNAAYDYAGAGGGDGVRKLAEMPKICFGTAQGLLDKTLPLALANGYTHIDGAEVYNNHRIVQEAIRHVQRQSLWITWKDNNITLEKIQEIVRKLQCGYIDLFLIHFGCGVAQDYVELKKAQSAGLIRFYGVSNCEDFDTIRTLKQEHNIFANQIQARPPGGSIQERAIMKDTFIEQCNAIGVSVMLYGTVSGILNSMDLFQEENYKYWIENKNLENINKYYIDKYVSSKPNVLMVSSVSVSGQSLKRNIFDVKKSIEGPLLTAEKFNEIERKLLQINFAKM